MMLIGYARVSTAGQDEQTQLDALARLGVDPTRIYVDHGFTGKTMTRDGLERALAAVRKGDTFVVPKFDRLARNTEGSLQVIRQLTERGVTFQNGTQPYDPHDPMAKLFITFLAAIAEAEGGWISLRTKEAMARPSVRRKLKGRQPKLSPKQDAAVVRHFEDSGFEVREIAAMFNISRASVYRAVERHRKRSKVADG